MIEGMKKSRRRYTKVVPEDAAASSLRRVVGAFLALWVRFSGKERERARAYPVLGEGEGCFSG